jgi:integrase
MPLAELQSRPAVVGGILVGCLNASAEMSVTIFELKPGKYRLRIEEGRDDAGKRKFRYERIDGIREDAELRRLEILRAARAGGDTGQIFERRRRPKGALSITVAEYLERWVGLREHRKEISASTAAWYRSIIGYALPALGDIPLSKLTAAQVQECYDELLTRIGPRTVRHVAARISSALSDALIEGLIDKNPLAGRRAIRLPKAPRSKAETLSTEDIQGFIRCAEAKFPTLAPVIRFAVLTGLRRGEICGLQWQDVRIARGEGGEITSGAVQVRRSAVQIGSTVELKEPKTAAGSRTVAIPGSEARALVALAGGDISSMDPKGFVFATQEGTGRLPNALTQQVNRALASCGLERFTLHDIRHAHATHLLAAGKPLKAVSQRLGHADVGVTMRTYQHVTSKDDEALADFAEGLLPPQAEEDGTDKDQAE